MSLRGVEAWNCAQHLVPCVLLVNSSLTASCVFKSEDYEQCAHYVAYVVDKVSHKDRSFSRIPRKVLIDIGFFVDRRLQIDVFRDTLLSSRSAHHVHGSKVRRAKLIRQLTYIIYAYAYAYAYDVTHLQKGSTVAGMAMMPLTHSTGVP